MPIQTNDAISNAHTEINDHKLSIDISLKYVFLKYYRSTEILTNTPLASL